MVTRRGWLNAAAAGFASLACSRKTTGDRSVKVAVGQRVTMAPVHLAYERGYFYDEHLDVSFLEVRSGREAVPLLAGGAADAGFLPFTPALVNAIARGARARIVAGRDSVKPGCSDQGALYYRAKRFPNGVQKAADWNGARIALMTDSSNSEFYLDSLLRHTGLPHDAVTVKRMNMEQSVAAAAAGHIDIFFGSGRPNFLDRGLPADVVRSDMVERTLGEFQYSHVIFGERLLDGDVSRGAAFLRAYLRGVRDYVRGDTPRFLDDFARRFNMKAELAKAACRNNISLNGEIRMADLDRWLSWAAAKGYLTRPVQTRDIVDLRFQEAASRGEVLQRRSRTRQC